ncbi:MAG: hypothetical protein IJV26_05490 [Lachnospiraceae bacterium]|nr:hypothetical protein [Lachnospiraceae bacterium]
MTEVSNDYLAKIRIAVRRSANEKTDAELKDIILQCRADLIRMGVKSTIANSEDNALVLGCQRAFARWQFGINGDEAERNREDYRTMANDLRKSQSVIEEAEESDDAVQ